MGPLRAGRRRSLGEKMLRKVGEVVALIEDYPFVGRSRDELRAGFRSFAAHPHIVFYRVVNDLPEIMRVLDGRQDVEELFADGDQD
jgi:toxin ParE1/3/4